MCVLWTKLVDLKVQCTLIGISNTHAFRDSNINSRRRKSPLSISFGSLELHLRILIVKENHIGPAVSSEILSYKHTDRHKVIFIWWSVAKCFYSLICPSFHLALLVETLSRLLLKINSLKSSGFLSSMRIKVVVGPIIMHYIFMEIWTFLASLSGRRLQFFFDNIPITFFLYCICIIQYINDKLNILSPLMQG